jgi:hypothetical protein
MRSFFEHISESNSQEIDQTLWTKWKSLMNLTRKEYADTLAIINLNDNDKKLSEKIKKMLEDSSSFEVSSQRWPADSWKICKEQVSYLTRMRSMRKRMVGNPFEKDGKPTKWLENMLAKGHDPRKPLKTD